MNKITTLATPDECLLVIIVGADDELSADEHYGAQCLAALVTLAETLDVHVISLVIDSLAERPHRTDGSGPVLQTTSSADPLADPSVERAVSEHKRRKLVLAGSVTEGTITFMALSALARGFDVYVVDDLCRSSSDRVHGVAIQRLAQAGAVITTALQLQAEWRAFSKFHGSRAAREPSYERRETARRRR